MLLYIYELTLWYSSNEEVLPDKECWASIRLDTPYISEGSNTVTEVASTTLPFTGAKELFFTSGVGGWATRLTLNSDGTFTGDFHDSEMGDITAAHPNGSYYTCKFSGKFTNIKKIDEYTYSLELSEMYTEVTPGKEWIEDGVLYRASTPYGLDEGINYIFYTEGAPTYSMHEEFMNWYGMCIDFNYPAKLDRCGLYNISAGYGFFD